MPRGISPKREREYKKLVQKFSRSGRYGARKKEVAARIVNKQRAERGETKTAKRSTTAKKKSSRAVSTRRRTSRKTTARRTTLSRSRR